MHFLYSLRHYSSEKTAFHQFNFSVFLHFIARGLYAIFVPIILLKNNYELNDVLWLLIFSSIVTMFSSYVSQRFFYRRQAIVFNILAVLSEIALMFAFSIKNFSLPLFTIIFICEGLYFGFYYVSYFSIISHYTSQKKVGKNVSNASIALNFAGLIAPVIGATLLDANPIYLISIAVFFLFISLVPLIGLTSVDINGVGLKKVQIFKVWREYFGYGILSAIEIIIYLLWATFAFLNGISLAMVSTIVVMSGLSNVLIAQKIKNVIANETVRVNFKYISLLFFSLLSLHRFFYPNQIFISNILFSVAYLVFSLCVETALLSKIKGYQTYHSSAWINIVAFAARIVVVLLVFAIGLKNIILAPIFLSALYLLVVTEKK